MSSRSIPSLLARSLAALALGAALWGGGAAAQTAASDWFVTGQGRVRLIAAEPMVGAAETVRLGLQFELAPHWKIYWRSPGDAGYPPHLDWAGSQNLADAAIAWPAPKRFTLFGLDTVGYENGVVLPIMARLQQAGQPLHLAAALQYLTCEQICIPYETTLRLDLPAGAASSSDRAAAELIARYEALVPAPGKAAGLALDGAAIETGANPVLVLHLTADPPLVRPDAFVEGPAGIGFGAPVLVNDDPRHPRLRLPVAAEAKAIPGLTGHPLTVTITDGSRAIEAVVMPGMTAPADRLARLLPMLLVALLGGLILNVMPCVLPVLSIKLLGAVAQAGRGSHGLRRGFLANAAGIVLAFLALAAVLIALRSAGVAVGWGLQFQQPVFLAAMAALLTLFAANLWGLFEIPLPGVIGERGGSRRQDGSIIGNLTAGAFATLLATPCSAPFLGTAIGFALAGTNLDILAIFLALGLGLALPYLAVAALPGFARLLPRPGPWMIVLRRVLGLALIGTALWLVFVLQAEAGPPAAFGVALLMALLWGLLVGLKTPLLRRLGIAAALAAILAVPLIFPVPASPPRAIVAQGVWQSFDRDRIAALVGGGKIVFVDVTADWCLTCQVNKRLVLDRPPVQEDLAAGDVVAMQADWTRPDPAIAEYLRSYGRYGIPFNAVYGPGVPGGIALSEVLTSGDVTAALDRARGTPAPGGASASGLAPETPRPETPSKGG